MNANLSYSYARCGALRHFHTRETLRRFSRGTPLPEPPPGPSDSPHGAIAGANDNYLFDMATRTESVPLILDVQPAWVLPVAIVLSFLGGCATFALVSLLVSRCRAARSDAQAARAREKPSLADQDAVAVACGSNRASAASCSRRSSHYQMRSSQHDTRASL